MAMQEKQKCKILYLKKILEEHTDPEHALTMGEILDELQAYGVPAERKSVYRDMDALREFGMAIERTGGRGARYYLDGTEFELPELKLLVDAVQSSRFITQKKSNELIRKLTNLTGRYQASELNRQVYVRNRVKTDNETIYYAVDTIHDAISSNRKITFRYFQWSPQKEKILRHDGKIYTVSPFALSWAEERYYLIAYDEESREVRHYRVDKMLDVRKTDRLRTGAEVFGDFDIAEYDCETFGMFGGKREKVCLYFPADMAGVIIDRFGEDVTIIPYRNMYSVGVSVQISPNFFGWLACFGGKIQIASPLSVSRQYVEFLESGIAVGNTAL